MTATDTKPNMHVNSKFSRQLVIVAFITSFVMVAVGSIATVILMPVFAPPQALPAQVYANANPLVTAECPTGDQLYHLASIRSDKPAMRMDGARQVDGKYRLTSAATFDANGSANMFTVKAEGKVPIDKVYVFNNTDATPTTTAKRDVVRYVVPMNTGTLVLKSTKTVPFSGNTHVFMCVPVDATRS